MDFIDLKMQQNKNGIFDLVFDNGGLKIDDTLETSIAATLFTDDYDNTLNFGQKRGCYGLYYGNNAWTKLYHSRYNDEEVISYVNNIYNNALNQDFVENNVYNFNNIEINSAFNQLYISIKGNKNINSDNKFSYNYKISGK